MNKFGVSNLRCLKDTGLVELKPINILVGKNSAGKSTFIRSFSLLRQSVEKNTNGPILWNGIYTDFGSFDDAIMRISNEDGEQYESLDYIKFSFSFNAPGDASNYYYYELMDSERYEVEFDASIKLKKGSYSSACYTSEYKLKCFDTEITFHLDELGVITGIESNKFDWTGTKEIKVNNKRSSKDTLLPFISDAQSISLEMNSTVKQLKDFLRDRIKNYGKVRLSEKVDQALEEFLCVESDEDRLKRFKSYDLSKTWSDTVESFENFSPDYLLFSGAIDLVNFIILMSPLNDEIGRILKNVHYIAPLRASSERYYRFQDLNVDELDHRGENLAMFLQNISEYDREGFNKWTKTNFGFEVNEDQHKGHVSICIITSNGKKFNIADSGFGYSQVLPVIVQLWSISSGYERKVRGDLSKEVIVAIEQPELHLHPALQAKLADIFVKSVELASSNSINLKLIVETHSQTIISRLGDLICMEQFFKDDVSVLVFDNFETEDFTKIRYSSFDRDGSLIDWPAGFFSYEVGL